MNRLNCVNYYSFYPTPLEKLMIYLFEILCPKDVTQSNVTNGSSVSKNTEYIMLLKKTT